MSDLLRVTTDYVEREDRLRLRGELQSGETVTLWLTRRLLDRLVQHLIRVLTTAGADLQGSAPLPADAPLGPQTPVQVPPDSAQWVADSVDITVGNRSLALTFRGPQGAQARLPLDPDPLRQWLDGIRTVYLAADWSLAHWEGWGEQKHSARQAPRFVH